MNPVEPWVHAAFSRKPQQREVSTVSVGPLGSLEYGLETSIADGSKNQPGGGATVGGGGGGSGEGGQGEVGRCGGGGNAQRPSYSEATHLWPVEWKPMAPILLSRDNIFTEIHISSTGGH